MRRVCAQACGHREGYDETRRAGPAACWSPRLATLYTVFLLYRRPQSLLLSFVIYAPGTVLFVMARRSRAAGCSPPASWHPAVSVAGALAGVVALVAGWITI